jgi:ribosome-associated protein
VLVIGERLRIPLSEFQFSYARAGGPGGQNVNKVSSKVLLRWDVAHSRSLPDDVRSRFAARFGRRLTASGELLLTSQRFRDQARNVADCLEKLRAMLAEVERAPRRRRATRPHRGSVERRLHAKRIHGLKKEHRGRPARDDS